MDIGKWTKRGSLLSIVTIAAASAITADVNLSRHDNITYRTLAGQVYEKADGIFAYTQLTLHKNGSVHVARHSLFSSVVYIDADNNGDVDQIYMLYGPRREKTERFFERTKHRKLLPNLFEDADKDFQEQEKRFGINPATQ